MSSDGAWRRIVVPVADGGDEHVMRVACRLAGDRARITAVAPVEIPRFLPLDAHMSEEEELARRALGRAEAIADSYGVAFAGKILRTRDPSAAVVEQVEASGAELVVIGAHGRNGGAIPREVGDVLKDAPCRVMLIAFPA